MDMLHQKNRDFGREMHSGIIWEKLDYVGFCSIAKNTRVGNQKDMTVSGVPMESIRSPLGMPLKRLPEEALQIISFRVARCTDF